MAQSRAKKAMQLFKDVEVSDSSKVAKSIIALLSSSIQFSSIFIRGNITGRFGVYRHWALC